jgi:hypothetical protein
MELLPSDYKLVSLFSTDSHQDNFLRVFIHIVQHAEIAEAKFKLGECVGHEPFYSLGDLVGCRGSFA